MQAINNLRNQGYTLTIERDDLIVKFTGAGHPDVATVKPLLAELKEHKAEAIAYLRQRDTLPLALAGADPGEVAKGRQQLRQKGYFLMFSQALGEKVAVCETEAGRCLVPQGLPVYTLAELTLLAEGHRAGTITTIADLRLLHTAKKKLGGVITR